MAKDIQMRYYNDEGKWEELNPSSKANIISTSHGENVEVALDNLKTGQTGLAKKDEVYSKSETYTKEEVGNLINDITSQEIPVQEEEPIGSGMWFEVLK